MSDEIIDVIIPMCVAICLGKIANFEISVTIKSVETNYLQHRNAFRITPIFRALYLLNIFRWSTIKSSVTDLASIFRMPVTVET